MFTGIVTEFGRVVDTRPTDPGRRMVVEAPDTTKGLQVGDSVAVNGVCLTAVAVDGAEFAVDAVRNFEESKWNRIDDIAPVATSTAVA